MLKIEKDKVASCGFEDVADARRCELDDEMAELRRLAAGKILKAVRCHSALSLAAVQHRAVQRRHCRPRACSSMPTAPPAYRANLVKVMAERAIAGAWQTEL